MNINDKVSFLVKNGTNRDGKEYFYIAIKVEDIEKVLVFLTKEQYLLITSSLKK